MKFKAMTEEELKEFIKDAQDQLLLLIRERVQNSGLMYANDLNPEEVQEK